jgi:uncharacterized membrane protein
MTDTPLYVRMQRLADHADLVATLCKPGAEYASMIRLQEFAEEMRRTAERLEARE